VSFNFAARLDRVEQMDDARCITGMRQLKFNPVNGMLAREQIAQLRAIYGKGSIHQARIFSKDKFVDSIRG
jgi:hypothetical protein